MVEGKEELVVDEPVFEMQEQAVVYLFSRYWERLPAFKDRVITRIHTHFPDFFVARKGKDDEAVEFEYKLSSFHSHLRGDVAKLRSRGIGKIYIVYWDQDDSVQVLTRKLQSLRLESVFVHLKEFFKAFVVFDEIAQRLRPSWRFQNVPAAEAYSKEQIAASVKQLADLGALRRMKIEANLYRTIGFNKPGAAYIELEHWQSIHLFSTRTPMSEEHLPAYLIVKPNGMNYISGVFRIYDAFCVLKGDEATQSFFRRFYFYPFEEKESHRYTDPEWKFFVCSYIPIERRLGENICKRLSKKYALGTRGSKIVDSADIPEVFSQVTALRD